MPRPETVRHHAENLLAMYCRAADEADAVAVGTLLRHAEVTFGKQPTVRGQDTVADPFAAAFAGQPVVRHLTSNLIVEPAPDGATTVARARYARWLLDPNPALAGLGDYELEIRPSDATDHPAWYTVRFRIIRTWLRRVTP